MSYLPIAEYAEYAPLKPNPGLNGPPASSTGAVTTGF